MESIFTLIAATNPFMLTAVVVIAGFFAWIAYSLNEETSALIVLGGFISFLGNAGVMSVYNPDAGSWLTFGATCFLTFITVGAFLLIAKITELR